MTISGMSMSDNNEKPENNETPETAVDAEATSEESPETEAEATAAETKTEDVIPESEPKASPARFVKKAASKDEEAFQYWPVEKDHGSVTRMLTAEAQDVDLSVGAKGGSSNFVLMVLIVGAAGAGIWQLSIVSSAEALEAKRQEREAAEKAHMEEMLKKQKIRRLTY